MKPRFRLIPRFYYSFRSVDVLYSLIPSMRNKRVFLDYFKTEKIYHLNSARAGLFLLLKSIAKGRALKVGIQPYSCETVFIAIVKAGCVPVFIDLNKDFSFDKEMLIENKNSIDVLIVTHTFGIISNNIHEVREILKDKIIIEDCAHAFLSEFNNQLSGTIGDASVFSMGYGKFPSIGHGGFVLINNLKLRENFEEDYSELKKPNFFCEIKELFSNYMYSLAFKSLIYGLITYPVFKKLDVKYDFVKKKSFEVFKGYRTNQNVFYNNFERYLTIKVKQRERAHQFLLMLTNISVYFNINKKDNCYMIPLLNPRRDEIYSMLFEEGFEFGKHFSKSMDIAAHYGYIEGSCPKSERIANEIIVTPSVMNLSVDDMHNIANLINKVIDDE